VVGFDSRAEGFFWLAGQGGYGIKTSPALSRTCATLIAARRLPEDLLRLGIAASELSPDRLLPRAARVAVTLNQPEPSASP
jgi:D-arginine dehydrogenase